MTDNKMLNGISSADNSPRTDTFSPKVNDEFQDTTDDKRISIINNILFALLNSPKRRK